MKVGFIAVVGRPNVGKSSLLNEIVEYPVSITSSTPQTTRNQIKAIYNDDDSQIIFLDTPGIHKPKQKLGDFLNKSAYKAINGADLNLFLTPINELLGPGDEFIINSLKKEKSIAVITKIDLGNIKTADKKINNLKTIGFKYITSTTIKNNKSIHALIKFLKDFLQEGTPYFNKEDVTDMSMRFIAGEIVREAAIDKTRDEIPHAISTTIVEFVETANSTKIQVIIYIQKKSQKGILIGKEGSMIKAIGIQARRKIEKLIGNKIFLDLKVKVDKNWTNDKNKIIKMGY